MQDAERNNRKTSEDHRDSPALAIGDAESRKSNSQSTEDSSSGNSPGVGSDDVVFSPVSTPAQDPEKPTSSGIQQPKPEPEPRSPVVTRPDFFESDTSILKQNLDLDLNFPTQSTSKQFPPLFSSEEETSPLIGTDQPFSSSVRPLNIPSVKVDSPSCLSQASTSEESPIRSVYLSKAIDNLKVVPSPKKRKKPTSPTSDKSSSEHSTSTESGFEHHDLALIPKQKKSFLSKVISRSTSPLKNKDKSPKDSASKWDEPPLDSQNKRNKSPSYSQYKWGKSPTNSPSKRDKSPSYSPSKRDKSPSYSPSKLEKSPTFRHGKGDKSSKVSPGKSAKSPSKFLELLKNTRKFLTGNKEESIPLLECKDTPKKVTKESKPAYNHWKGQSIPAGFKLEKDVHSSETTCDSGSTQFSMASLSTDSLESDTGCSIRTNISDRTPEIPNSKSPNPQYEDSKMDES